MNKLKDFANDTVIKDLALECKQYRELIPRLCDDLAAVKKAHKEALEFNYDLAEENTAVHTKALAMQERIAALEQERDTLANTVCILGTEVDGRMGRIEELGQLLIARDKTIADLEAKLANALDLQWTEGDGE